MPTRNRLGLDPFAAAGEGDTGEADPPSQGHRKVEAFLDGYADDASKGKVVRARKPAAKKTARKKAAAKKPAAKKTARKKAAAKKPAAKKTARKRAAAKKPAAKKTARKRAAAKKPAAKRQVAPTELVAGTASTESAGKPSPRKASGPGRPTGPELSGLLSAALSEYGFSGASIQVAAGLEKHPSAAVLVSTAREILQITRTASGGKARSRSLPLEVRVEQDPRGRTLLRLWGPEKVLPKKFKLRPDTRAYALVQRVVAAGGAIWSIRDTDSEVRVVLPD
jgi:hypothetical protein